VRWEKSGGYGWRERTDGLWAVAGGGSLPPAGGGGGRRVVRVSGLGLGFEGASMVLRPREMVGEASGPAVGWCVGGMAGGGGAAHRGGAGWRSGSVGGGGK
jgi:hypothetical protein